MTSKPFFMNALSEAEGRHVASAVGHQPCGDFGVREMGLFGGGKAEYNGVAQ